MSNQNTSAVAAADVSVSLGENGAQHATVQVTEEQKLRQEAHRMGIIGAVWVQRFIDLRTGSSSVEDIVPRDDVCMTRK